MTPSHVKQASRADYKLQLQVQFCSSLVNTSLKLAEQFQSSPDSKITELIFSYYPWSAARTHPLGSRSRFLRFTTSVAHDSTDSSPCQMTTLSVEQYLCSSTIQLFSCLHTDMALAHKHWSCVLLSSMFFTTSDFFASSMRHVPDHTKALGIFDAVQHDCRLDDHSISFQCLIVCLIAQKHLASPLPVLFSMTGCRQSNICLYFATSFASSEYTTLKTDHVWLWDMISDLNSLTEATTLFFWPHRSLAKSHNQIVLHSQYGIILWRHHVASSVVQHHHVESSCEIIL